MGFVLVFVRAIALNWKMNHTLTRMPLLKKFSKDPRVLAAEETNRFSGRD